MSEPFRPDPDRLVTSAARHFGINTDWAFLLADMVLAEFGLPSAWPVDHVWHAWAVRNAEAAHGRKAVRALILCMAEAYDEKFPGWRRAA